MKFKFGEVVGAIIGLISLVAIAWLAVVSGNEPAVGALILMAGKLGDWVFRGRIQEPNP